MEIEREGEFGVVVGLARNAPRDPKGRGKNERKNEKKKTKYEKKRKKEKNLREEIWVSMCMDIRRQYTTYTCNL